MSEVNFNPQAVNMYQSPMDEQGLVGLLPPEYQKEKEIEAIKNNLEIIEALDGHEILEIAKDDYNSMYYIKTENALIRAEVKYLPNDLIGPAKFEIVYLDKRVFEYS